MLNQLKKQSGFTIIELLIVIAIIGILATLVLTNFQGAQAKGRDTVRTTDINSIYQKLEEFYNENGGYPDGDLNGTVAVSINEAETLDDVDVLPGIDDGALTDENDQVILAEFSTVEAPTTDPAIPASTDTKEYVYRAYECLSAISTGASGIGAGCKTYTLATFLEREEAGYFKVSLN